MLDTTLTFGGAFFMAGITLEQKIDAIFRFENGDESLTSIAKSLTLFKRTILVQLKPVTLIVFFKTKFILFVMIK